MRKKEEKIKIVHSASWFSRIVDIGLTTVVTGTCFLALLALLKVYNAGLI